MTFGTVGHGAAVSQGHPVIGCVLVGVHGQVVGVAAVGVVGQAVALLQDIGGAVTVGVLAPDGVDNHIAGGDDHGSGQHEGPVARHEDRALVGGVQSPAGEYHLGVGIAVGQAAAVGQGDLGTAEVVVGGRRHSVRRRAGDHIGQAVAGGVLIDVGVAVAVGVVAPGGVHGETGVLEGHFANVAGGGVAVAEDLVHRLLGPAGEHHGGVIDVGVSHAAAVNQGGGVVPDVGSGIGRQVLHAAALLGIGVVGQVIFAVLQHVGLVVAVAIIAPQGIDGDVVAVEGDLGHPLRQLGFLAGRIDGLIAVNGPADEGHLVLACVGVGGQIAGIALQGHFVPIHIAVGVAGTADTAVGIVDQLVLAAVIHVGSAVVVGVHTPDGVHGDILGGERHLVDPLGLLIVGGKHIGVLRQAPADEHNLLAIGGGVGQTGAVLQGNLVAGLVHGAVGNGTAAAVDVIGQAVLGAFQDVGGIVLVAVVAPDGVDGDVAVNKGHRVGEQIPYRIRVVVTGVDGLTAGLAPAHEHDIFLAVSGYLTAQGHLLVDHILVAVGRYAARLAAVGVVGQVKLVCLLHIGSAVAVAVIAPDGIHRLVLRAELHFWDDGRHGIRSLVDLGILVRGPADECHFGAAHAGVADNVHQLSLGPQGGYAALHILVVVRYDARTAVDVVGQGVLVAVGLLHVASAVAIGIHTPDGVHLDVGVGEGYLGQRDGGCVVGGQYVVLGQAPADEHHSLAVGSVAVSQGVVILGHQGGLVAGLVHGAVGGGRHITAGDVVGQAELGALHNVGDSAAVTVVAPDGVHVDAAVGEGHIVRQVGLQRRPVVGTGVNLAGCRGRILGPANEHHVGAVAGMGGLGLGDQGHDLIDHILVGIGGYAVGIAAVGVVGQGVLAAFRLFHIGLAVAVAVVAPDGVHGDAGISKGHVGLNEVVGQGVVGVVDLGVFRQAPADECYLDALVPAVG